MFFLLFFFFFIMNIYSLALIKNLKSALLCCEGNVSVFCCSFVVDFVCLFFYAFGRLAFLESKGNLGLFNKDVGINKKSFQLQIGSYRSKYRALPFQLLQSTLCSYSSARITVEIWKKKMLFFQVASGLINQPAGNVGYAK